MTSDRFSVRLLERDQARDLTPHVTSLGFKSVDPGGMAGCQFNLSRELDALEFDVFADIAVFDNRNGKQVGGGRLRRPGRGVDAEGNGVWKVEGLGEGIASTQERRNPYWLISSELGRWGAGLSSSRQRTWSVGTTPTPPGHTLAATDGLIFTMGGTPSVGDNAFTQTRNWDMREFEDQFIGGIGFSHYEGIAESDFKVAFELIEVGFPTTIRIVQNNWSMGAGPAAPFERLREVNDGAGQPDLWTSATRYHRATIAFLATAAVTGVGDEHYINVMNTFITASRKNRAGADNYPPAVAGDYKTGYVLGHDAVVDVIARWCPRLDIEHARIADTAFEHKQLVWYDGVTPYEVLEYLMEVEQEFTWAVWERQLDGTYEFEWREKSTDVRYELGEGADISFELTGGENERLSTLWVQGRDIIDRYLTFRTSDTDVNDPFAGLDIEPTDTIPIEVANGTDWGNEAASIGVSLFEQSKLNSTSAKATLRDGGRYYDNYEARWVEPWEVLPGYLARTTGVRPIRDTMNDPTFTPDSAILRIVSNDYSDEQGAAQVEMNSYTVDERRALANVMKRAGVLR